MMVFTEATEIFPQIIYDKTYFVYVLLLVDYIIYICIYMYIYIYRAFHNVLRDYKHL
jgi:hypothetical protein